VGKWTKGEVIEGVVSGGERIHGYTPDGTLLCGALGEDGGEPLNRAGPHRDPVLFTDETANGCRRCIASWRKLTDD
jgi:hypothetical protein